MRQNLIRPFFLGIVFGGLVLIAITGCYTKPEKLSAEAREQNIEYLIQEGLHLWEQRSNPDMVRKSCQFLASAYEVTSPNLNLIEMLSRAYYFQAHYLTNDPVLQDSLYLRGAMVAEEGLSASLRGMTGSDSLTIEALLPFFTQEHIPVLYWWAANFGSYLLTKPVVQRLKKREIFENILHQMLVLNPNFYFGGPYRLFGVFYTRIPGVELDRAESYFNQAIDAYPDYFATKVLKARYYYTKTGDREQFHATLTSVIEADPTSIPDVMPENLLEQKLARSLLEKEHLLFE
ncbi:MAG: TRAP transporter TatT component family protein [Fidelibacterota bacterium]